MAALSRAFLTLMRWNWSSDNLHVRNRTLPFFPFLAKGKDSMSSEKQQLSHQDLLAALEKGWKH